MASQWLNQRRVQRTDLLLNVGGLVLRCTRYHARIRERRPQQGAHCKHKQTAADDWNGERDANGQIRTTVLRFDAKSPPPPNKDERHYNEFKREPRPPTHKKKKHHTKFRTHSKAKNSVLVNVMRKTVK